MASFGRLYVVAIVLDFGLGVFSWVTVESPRTSAKSVEIPMGSQFVSSG